MKKYNPVVHFEMPYKDKDRVANFYQSAFGWGMNKLGEEMGHYITAETTETDNNHMVKNPGNINGGFYPLKSAPTATCPSVVIGVADIKEAMQNVEKAGGKVLGKPMEIKDIGQYVSFTDTEGNRVSLLEPKKK